MIVFFFLHISRGRPRAASAATFQVNDDNELVAVHLTRRDPDGVELLAARLNVLCGASWC